MANVIPLKPNGEGLNPSQIINRLHDLCEELQHVKSKGLHLETLLHCGTRSTKQGLVAQTATSETIVLVSTAIDVVVGAVAELIVETTAELIVSPSPAKTCPAKRTAGLDCLPSLLGRQQILGGDS